MVSGEGTWGTDIGGSVWTVCPFDTLGHSSSYIPRGKAWDDQDCRLMQDFSDTSHAYSPPHSQHLRQGRRESLRGQSKEPWTPETGAPCMGHKSQVWKWTS